jgi:hypothetical protein
LRILGGAMRGGRGNTDAAMVSIETFSARRAGERQAAAAAGLSSSGDADADAEAAANARLAAADRRAAEARARQAGAAAAAAAGRPLDIRMELSLSARDLPRSDARARTDAAVALYVKNERTGVLTLRAQTEVVRDDQSPNFKTRIEHIYQVSPITLAFVNHSLAFACICYQTLTLYSFLPNTSNTPTSYHRPRTRLCSNSAFSTSTAAAQTWLARSAKTFWAMPTFPSTTSCNVAGRCNVITLGFVK